MDAQGARTARDLVRVQVDEALGRWRAAELPGRPPNGWARSIRSALGMSARALASRLHMTEPGLRKLEDSEISESITLRSLRKLADALECDLQYALVPRKPLDEMLLDRARAVAAAEFGPVAHSMALEQQAVDALAREKQVEAWARALVARGATRELWR